MKTRIPQYLHLPPQVLWFDTEEIMVMVVMYVIAMVFGGWTWLGLLVGPYSYMQVKRKQPRGFLRHVLYQVGLFSMVGYPPPFSHAFYE